MENRPMNVHLLTTGSLIALLAVGIAGCKSETRKSDSAAQSASTDTAGQKPPAPTGTIPMGGASDDAYAPLSPSPELDQAIEAAVASKDNKKIAEAYTTRGAYRTRGDEKAGQRVKYRAALSDFRKALELDPKNIDAAAGKNEIEQIYTMMGREIPSPEECDEVSRTGRYTPKKSAEPAPKSNS